MLTKIHTESLKNSIERLLINGTEGTVVFIRCLQSELVFSLIENEDFRLTGWNIFAVTNEVIKNKYNNSNIITSDQAVDLRESKKEKVLLLVDTLNVGAGMDGIYSATREIKEKELFDRSIKYSLNKFNKDKKVFDFLKMAINKAKSIGRNNTISPWQIFDFYSNCANNVEDIGIYLTKIGLWPIKIENYSEEILDISAQIVEKLLLETGIDKTPKSRIDSLLLKEETTKEQINELTKFLDNSMVGFWRDKLLNLADKTNLWLNNLEPGFLSNELVDIEILPWRDGDKGKPYAWSGLKSTEDDTPIFYIEKNVDKPKKLLVRWKTSPQEIKKNSIVYQVSIVTEDNSELVSLNDIHHSGKTLESCSFSLDDFEAEDSISEEFEKNEGKWDAKIQIKPLFESGENAKTIIKETEPFILTFGETESRSKSSVGTIVRALIEEAIKHNKEDFFNILNSEFREDNKGYITYKASKNIGRVFRPDLIKFIEEDWQKNNFPLGRWSVQIREDGSISKHPSFIPIDSSLCDDSNYKKLIDVTNKMGEFAMKKISFIGLIYHQDEPVVNNYINTWSNAFESLDKDFILANTLEVRNLKNEVLGIIILPSHPILVAWHYAYDTLLYYAKFEENLSAIEISQISNSIDGAYYPFLLPGLEKDNTFVFGDKLGFYNVAMIPEKTNEPQAIISILARCLSSKIFQEDEKKGDVIATSIGNSLSSLIGREIEKYSNLHKEYPILCVNAIRPGDSKTVTQALGNALKRSVVNDIPNSFIEGYRLNLYPSTDISLTVAGKYLTEIAEKRRLGSGTILESDKWVLETFSTKEEIPMPRLRLAKYRNSNSDDNEPLSPKSPSHISIVFDTFKTTLKMIELTEIKKGLPLEGFGLFPNLSKVYSNDPIPTWKTTIAIDSDGEKHPLNKSITNRLIRTHYSILKSIPTLYGYNNKEYWPVLVTEVDPMREDSIKILHEMSDWVISIDKNAGIEFFDAPKDNPDIYDTYVIDCVPERKDIGTIQQITSTSQLEEIKRLLEKTLDEMELSYSSKNCTFLLSNLKAISGQLAMRLCYDRGNVKKELIALSLFYSCCKQFGNQEEWFPLDKGFLVPVDDIRDLLDSNFLKNKQVDEENSYIRSDLIYVSLDNLKSNNLQFSFIEIKYRKLRQNVNGNLFKDIIDQTKNTRKNWVNKYFSEKLTKFQLSINRKKLAKSLQFYADKAKRNNLHEEIHEKLTVAINKLYDPSYLLDNLDVVDKSYIFCPQYFDDVIKVFTQEDKNIIYLFGPTVIPNLLPKTILSSLSNDFDEIYQQNGSKIENKLSFDQGQSEEIQENPIIKPSSVNQIKESNLDKNEVLLGTTKFQGNPVSLKITTKGNPHLMIVGLPGMGKTTTILNICQQMNNNKIVPIVFSYHDDMETAFLKLFNNDVNIIDLEKGIGFNPLRVTKNSPSAWLDNIGMLRDIFKAVFPAFGDIMINEIRRAIKESYTDLSYGSSTMSNYNDLPTPEFQTFFNKLKNQKKPDQRILMRLEELDEYGFFKNSESGPSILDLDKPTIIALHRTHNDTMKNALASFILFNIYQSMFLRGEKENITHTIIFDEAHRASKLSLIGTMAKESRKYGISFIVASQESKDFDSSIYAAIGNYLILRVNEPDAKVLAKNLVSHNEILDIKSKLILLEKFHALLFTGDNKSTLIKLKGLDV
jgi:DNA phosphorothioation-dependent restriction protein DptH